MLIMIIFLILSILLALLTFLYLRHQKTEHKNTKINDKNRKRNKKSLKDIINFEIKDNLICLDDRYSCVVKISNIDYYMLSEDEQEIIEDILMQTALAFDGSIQFYSTTESIDTTKNIETIKKSTFVNEQTERCKDNLINYLQELMTDCNKSIVKSFIIISYDGLYKNAMQELTRKVSTIKSNLLKAKIQCEVLNNTEIQNLLNFN